MTAGVSYNFTTGQFGANAGVNAAQGSQSRAWVETPSGILTDRDLTVTAGGHTQLTGGVIGSRSGGLTLETETLGTQDLALHERNRHVSGGVNVSVGVSAEGKVSPGGSLEGSYANAEKEGIARATIGQGTIVVRDGDGNGVTAAKLRAEADAAEASGDPATAAALRAQAEAEEASDKSATDTQLASINRDLDTVIEVTRETEEGFDLYVSDTSVRTLGKVLSALGDAIKELEVSPEQKKVLERLAACTSRQGYNSFNPLNWLITPAYASDCSDTTIQELMIGIDRETLEKLVEACEDLDPSVAAYAKATLASRIYAELPSSELAKLRSMSKWDIEGVKKLDYDTIRMLELANDAMHCQDPACSQSRHPTFIQLYGSIDHQALHIATFLRMTPPSESSLGINTTGMSWSTYIAILQAEEIVSQGVGTAVGAGAGVAISKAASYLSARVGPKIASVFESFVGSQNKGSKGLCSFHGDTLVLTDGGLLPISDVNTSMTVWSRNPVNGDMTWQRVQAQYSNPYDETVSVTIRDVETGVEQTIVSNRIHPYFVQTERVVASSSDGHVYDGELENGHWVDAADLQAGDRLLNDDGTWAAVVGVEIKAEPLTAFNLTVAGFHTYFVAANANAAPVWVHNDCFDQVFSSRNGAFRGAKEQAGIPRSAQPTTTYTEPLLENGIPVRNADGSPVMTRNYVYDHPVHGQVVIKEHSLGHPQFTGQAAANPHFNVGIFRGQGERAGNIPGVSGHYVFD
ncbi:polymorphic toxin-type HINT domain-containing protein [Pannonibacter sp. Q-1]